MSEQAEVTSTVDSAAELRPEARQALRDLLLSLADNKRLLGLRYSDWMLGAPTIETGIAASSMAQDEWGHGRLTYALLSDFGDEPRELEHEREASGYHSAEVLDGPLESWSGMIAACLLLDTAFTVQYTALLDSAYAPAHNRVQKLLDEEEYHFQYGAGWATRIAASGELGGKLRDDLRALLPVAMKWLGPDDAPGARAMREAGVVTATPSELRQKLIDRVAPLLRQIGMADDLGLTQGANGWSWNGSLEWSGWDEAKRRSGGNGPDEDTLSRARGDRNRAVLMD